MSEGSFFIYSSTRPSHQVSSNFHSKIISQKRDANPYSKRTLNDIENRNKQTVLIHSISGKAKGEEDIKTLMKKINKATGKTMNNINDVENAFLELQEKLTRSETKCQKLERFQAEKIIPSSNADTEKKLLISKIDLLEAKINNFERTKQNLIEDNTNLLKENELLKLSLEEIQAEKENDMQDKEKFKKKLHRKVKALKEELLQSKDEITELQINLIKKETEIQELSLKLSSENPPTPKEMPNIVVEHCLSFDIQAIDKLHDVIKQQSEEYEEIFNQRNKLMSQLSSSLHCMENYEKSLSSTKIQLQTATNSLQELEESHKTYVETQKAKFTAAFDQLLNIIPSETVEEVTELSDQPIDEILTGLANILIGYYDEILSECETPEDIKEKHNTLLKKYKSQFIVLQNTVDFLRELSCSSGSESIRDAITENVARVNLYLDMNNDDPMVMKILGQNADLQSLIQIVLNHIDEEQQDSTPFAEIITILSIITTMNNMLINRINDANKRISEYKQAAARNQDVIARMKKEAEDSQFYYNCLKSAAPAMGMLFEDPPADLVTLVENFRSAAAEGLVTLPQHQEAIFELQSQIEEAKASQSESNVKLEEEKRIFADKSMKLISKLKEQLKSHTSQVEERVKKAETSLKEAEARLAEFEDRHNAQTQKIDEKTTNIAKLESENTQTKEALENLVQENQQLKSQLSSMENEASQKDGDIDELKTVTAKTAARNRLLKAKLVQVQKDRAGLLENLKKDAESTRSKYATEIERLTSELKESVKRQETAEAASAASKGLLAESRDELTRLRAELKGATARAAAAERHAKCLEEGSAAKVRAVQISAESRIQELIDSFEATAVACRKALAEAALVGFGVLPDGSSPLSDVAADVASLFRARQDSPEYRVAKDALRLQRSLNRGAEYLLSAAFADVTEEAERYQSKLADALLKIDSQRCEIGKLKEAARDVDNARAELFEWNRWGRALYERMKDGSGSARSGEDLRFVISESLMVAVSFRTIERRIDTLRKEKQLLLRQRIPGRSRAAAPIVLSARPIAHAVLFLHRLLEFGGFVPAKYAYRQAVDLPHTQ